VSLVGLNEAVGAIINHLPFDRAQEQDSQNNADKNKLFHSHSSVTVQKSICSGRPWRQTSYSPEKSVTI
jgi:hypothetical protein